MLEVEFKVKTPATVSVRTGRSAKLVELMNRLVGLSDSTKLKIKLGISLSLIASLFLLGKVDLSKVWQVTRTADFRFVLLAACLIISSTFLNGYRWKVLAGAVGLQSPFLKLTQYCFVGLFFNLFFPSTVGGDFSRCYYLYKDSGNYRGAFISVLADRAVGISVLFLFASAGLLMGPGGSQLPWELKLPVFIGTFTVFVIVPFMPVATRILLGGNNWLARQFNNSSAQVYWRDKNMILFCLLLSIALQIVFVGCHISIGFALGLKQIPLWYYFVFYPSVTVLGFITPSFNGIGIREWAYTYFLTLMGIDRDSALTYAIMMLAMTTFASLFGGLVYLSGHFTFSKAEAEQLRHQSI